MLAGPASGWPTFLCLLYGSALCSSPFCLFLRDFDTCSIFEDTRHGATAVNSVIEEGVQVRLKRRAHIALLLLLIKSSFFLLFGLVTHMFQNVSRSFGIRALFPWLL